MARLAPLLSGLWAWLSWDFERLGVTWAHAASSTWAPRYFSECSPEPLTALWEVAIILGLTILIVGNVIKKTN